MSQTATTDNTIIFSASTFGEFRDALIKERQALLGQAEKLKEQAQAKNAQIAAMEKAFRGERKANT